MPRTKYTKPWPVAEASFVEVEITHPRDRQMHVIFENGSRLVIADRSQIPLAAELIAHLRKMEKPTKGGRS